MTYRLIYQLGSKWIPLTNPCNYAVCKAKEKEYKGKKGFVKLHIVKAETDLSTHIWQ
jgi:hypothetical protein